MDVNYLKRSCESLLESSKDLLGDQTSTEALKKTRLYATQVVDLLEEKECSFIDLLLKVKKESGTPLSSMEDLVDWVNLFVQIAWFDNESTDILSLTIANHNTHAILFAPVLKYLGFAARCVEIEGKEQMTMKIETLVNPNTGSVGRKYKNHEYGDREIVQTRRDMYDAFWNRQLKPRQDSHDAHLIERKDIYLANLRTTLLRDLGLFLDVQTLKCTADNERVGEILFNRLL